MFNLGTPELIVLLVIGVVLFGRRLPEIGRSVGRSVVEFRKGLQGVEDEVQEAVHRESPASSQEVGV